jgi:DNA transformation protein
MTRRRGHTTPANVGAIANKKLGRAAPARERTSGGLMASAQDSFVAYVVDQLREVEGLGCRAMFGGHGLYRGSTFFGIVFEGQLYLKTDDSTVSNYTRRSMRPFRPNDRQLLKTYYEVPADVLEDRRRLSEWAEAAARCAGDAAAGAVRPGRAGSAARAR